MPGPSGDVAPYPCDPTAAVSLGVEAKPANAATAMEAATRQAKNVSLMLSGTVSQRRISS